jgi:hypothetical protein
VANRISILATIVLENWNQNINKEICYSRRERRKMMDMAMCIVFL